MFLTTLLSDAAEKHGHEFSSPRASTPARLSPIPRAMRPQSALTKTRLPQVSKGAVTSSGLEAQGKMEKVMFKEEAEVKIVEGFRRSMSESSEEEAQLASHRTDPISRVVEASPVRRPKDARPRTAYTFAHTAAKPTALHKLRSRPPAVLQLQQVFAGARPKPALEVFPSGRYAKKLGRDLARLHKGKDKLGADDVVICKAQEYHASEDDDDWQEVVGIVCASCKDESHASGNAQLCLEDGSTWEAVPHPKGRFDFVSTDEYGHRRTVRWVARRVRGRQRGAPNAQDSPFGSTSSDELVYRFSTIDPSKRRHPVLATMTPKGLEINDLYYMPRSTLAAAPDLDDADAEGPDSVSSPGLEEDAPRLASEREPLETTALLRSLILLSGIYVALKNNWSPVFSYRKDSTKSNDSKSPSRTNSLRSNNASPAPSIDGVPIGTTRRHTFTFHRRSSTACASPSSAMSQALHGSFNDSSLADPSVTSRSSTPESQRWHTNAPSTLRHSATDRVSRNLSNATTSAESTNAEGSVYSRQSGSVSSMSRTPTPSTRLNDAAPPSGFGPPQRSATVSGGFPQRASVSLDQRDEEGLPRNRRFSFSRGRTLNRHEKTMSMIDNRPPAAYHNSQWWVDWGSTDPPRQSTSTAIHDPAGAATDLDTIAESRPGTAQRPGRRSFSLQSWRRKEVPERPKSMFVGDVLGQADGRPSLSKQPAGSPITPRQTEVVNTERRQKSGGGLGGMVRRVTQRLRREERKLG